MNEEKEPLDVLEEVEPEIETEQPEEDEEYGEDFPSRPPQTELEEDVDLDLDEEQKPKKAPFFLERKRRLKRKMGPKDKLLVYSYEDEEIYDEAEFLDDIQMKRDAWGQPTSKVEGVAIGVLVCLAVIATFACILMYLDFSDDIQLDWESSTHVGRQDQEYDDYYDVMGSMPEIEVELQRAETGDGTQLELVEDGLETLTLQEIYQKLNPTVVAITATGVTGMGTGTGVIFTEDGYIITNAHVIADSFRADVVLADGRSYEAMLVGEDESTDLAVLKIEETGLPVATFASSDALTVGDDVAAIGNPFGEELRGTLTNGIISAINRDMVVEDKEMTLLQTTAALNPGNSGGPLINMYGNVIGITNMKLMGVDSSTTVEGLGFAIPSTTVKTVVDALIADGVVTGRPMLGIVVQQVTPADLAERGLDNGLWVISIQEASLANDAGLLAGDILLTADGVTLTTNDDLLAEKDALSVGDLIHFEIYRDGVYMELDVPLTDQYLLE